MTVTYTQKVSDCKGFGSFWRLLFRWRGSVYKLVWPDLLVYCFLYFICSMVYRFGLNEDQRRTFEQMALYCDYFRNLIPISFVLGFYVSVVVQRWWEQYLSIPWPDDFSLYCTAYIKGKDGIARQLRSTLLRYMNLNFVITFSEISCKVKKKFPNFKALLDAGYVNAEEMHILEAQSAESSVPLNIVPLMWCSMLIEKARSQGYVRDDFGMKMLMEEIGRLRDNSGMLVRWTDMSIPLVYTQVATMAVYSFFFFSVLGRQFLDPGQHYANRTIDFFVPVFTLLQFFFYMGWLKVAESLVNPFGEDDDDFDLDKILERHFEMSYLLGNITMTYEPVMVRDLNSFNIFSHSQPEGGYRRHSEAPHPSNCQIKLGTNGILPKTATLQPNRPSSLKTNASSTLKLSPTRTNQPSPTSAGEQHTRSDPNLKCETRPPSTSDPSNPFDFLWEEMDASQASDDQNCTMDSTPILPSKPGGLEASTPSISAATTPTDDVNINCRFANAQENASDPTPDQTRSNQHRGPKALSGHSGESPDKNRHNKDGHINPSYVEC